MKSKGGGEKTIHFNGSEETVELILRTVIAVNQLSIYGAVEDLGNELDPDYAKNVIGESLMMPAESADANAISQSSTHQHRETCYKIISRNSQIFLKITNCRNYVPTLVS